MDILKRISTAIGLLALTAAPALAQMPNPTQNQATADRVADALRAAANRAGSRIEIETRSGLVTLAGTVANQGVKTDLIARARQVPGVTAVEDRLRISGDSRVQPAQYQPAPTRVAMGGHHHAEPVFNEGAMMGPVNAHPADEPVIMDPGPMPEEVAGAGATQAAIHVAPNYAWPASAPGAVGYPTVYPWQAMANATPPYPNPEIPLDWRTVTLRWDNGLWWLDFKKHNLRPFFSPWPWGIFPY